MSCIGFEPRTSQLGAVTTALSDEDELGIVVHASDCEVGGPEIDSHSTRSACKR